MPFQPELLAADSNARHLERPAGSDPTQLGYYYYTRLCIGCHGPDLAGAPPLDPAAPPGANLTPAGNLRNLTYEQFKSVFATGRTPRAKRSIPRSCRGPPSASERRRDPGDLGVPADVARSRARSAVMTR